MILKICRLCTLKVYEAGEYIFNRVILASTFISWQTDRLIWKEPLTSEPEREALTIGTLGKGRVPWGAWSTLLNEPSQYNGPVLSASHPAKILVMKGSDLREMMIQINPLAFMLWKDSVFF